MTRTGLRRRVTREREVGRAEASLSSLALPPDERFKETKTQKMFRVMLQSHFTADSLLIARPRMHQLSFQRF